MGSESLKSQLNKAWWSARTSSATEDYFIVRSMANIQELLDTYSSIENFITLNIWNSVILQVGGMISEATYLANIVHIIATKTLRANGYTWLNGPASADVALKFNDELLVFDPTKAVLHTEMVFRGALYSEWFLNGGVNYYYLNVITDLSLNQYNVVHSRYLGDTLMDCLLCERYDRLFEVYKAENPKKMRIEDKNKFNAPSLLFNIAECMITMDFSSVETELKSKFSKCHDWFQISPYIAWSTRINWAWIYHRIQGNWPCTLSEVLADLDGF